MRVQVLEVTQPIGTFYMCSLPAEIVLKISEVKQRSSGEGYQRDESKKRVKEITNYAEKDPDATFPTPIIIAVNDSSNFHLENGTLTFDEDDVIGSVIDGQHRLLGLEKIGNLNEFQLPVFFMIELTIEEQAYVFSIINSKQTKVPNSIIYDLFELSVNRSPQKTSHDIARLFNSDEGSPFYKRLKMLGKKEGEFTSLSQASFSNELLKLITKRPDEDLLAIKNGQELQQDDRCPFRKYFVENDDSIIYKIMNNIFSAVKEVFSNEWDNPNQYILTKPVGYIGIMKALPELFRQGYAKKNLQREYFLDVFTKFKEKLEYENLELTSKDFPSSGQTSNKIANLIKDCK